MTAEHNIVYRMEGFTVNVIQRQIITAQRTINVRPKTFSLLLLFLESPFQVLSKDYLLKQIWDDVLVEEQVLVQSIRELRQLFSPLDIIQTHPRKGYAWSFPIEKVNQSIDPIAIEASSNCRRKRIKTLIASGIVLLVTMGVLVVKNYMISGPASKNIITVLPVENRTEGSNLVWVRLGMMDQLIQSLQLSQGVQVFDVPYVLHLLDVAGVDAVDRVQLANRIFEISGSNLVVDLELSGSVNDYRLLYRLLTPTDQTSGVIMENQLDKVVESLARVVATKTDARLNLSHLDAEFNSSLLAEAFENRKRGKTDTAIALLQTAITIEPDNFLAHQLLIESLQIQNAWPQAVDNTMAAVAIATQHQYPKVYVFHYLLAKAQVAQGDIERARHQLMVAQELAVSAFDSLYQAYIASLAGDIALKTADLQTAEVEYQRSIGYHQSIACPIGVSLVRLKLIELYSLQQRDDLAVEQWRQLKKLVDMHQLPLEVPSLGQKTNAFK